MTTGFSNSEFTGDLAKCVFSAVLGQESDCSVFKREWELKKWRQQDKHLFQQGLS